MQVVRRWLRSLNYRAKRRFLEQSIATADQNADEWAVRALAASREHGVDSEPARHANERLGYFTGVYDRSRALLARLEAEDKP